MSALTDALERILNWFQENKPDYAASLQPGLTIEEIEEKVKNLPFKLPKEVYELYQWQNGMCDEYGGFFEYYRFLPLEEALCKEQRMSEPWGLSLPFGWFPLFYFENEYFSAISAEEDTASSVIVKTYHGIDVAYSSLTNMMQYLAECYEKKAYFIDENGGLSKNNSIANDILIKYETELAYPQNTREKVVNNCDGSQLLIVYHNDSNNIL